MLLLFIAAFPGNAAMNKVNGFGEAAWSLASVILEHVRPQVAVVAANRGGNIYVNLGRGDRVRPGQLLEVVRPGPELKHPLTGEVIGVVEEPLGLLELTTVRESFSIGRMLSEEMPPAEGDIVYTYGKELSLAVAPFTLLTGRSLTQGMVFSERLGALLAQEPALRLIEREQLHAALSELNFAQTGLVDAASAKELGAFLGVSVMVLGTIAESGSSVALTMRMIEVETGLILLAHTVDVLGETLSGSTVERPVVPSVVSSPIAPISAVSSTSASAQDPLTGTDLDPAVRPVSPAVGGQGTFDVLFRQQLPETMHRFAIGDLQGRGPNLAGLNQEAATMYVYRFRGEYERIWETRLPARFIGNVIYVTDVSNPDNRRMASSSTFVRWDAATSRWISGEGPQHSYPVPGDASLYANGVPIDMRIHSRDSSRANDPIVEVLQGALAEPVSFGYPLIGRPFPGGEYMVALFGSGNEFIIKDKSGVVQWRSADLAAVTAGLSGDFDGSDLDKFVLAQFVDEYGQPDISVIEQLLEGGAPPTEDVRSRLVVVAWDDDLLQPRVISQSPVFAGERIWDMKWADVDEDGVTELVVLAGSIDPTADAPSSIYHVRVNF